MIQPPDNATTRFSDRVGNYAKYRPGYPPEVITLLAEKCGLLPTGVVADVGSGTGIITRMFLENGNTVHAIEPNAPMREAAEADLVAFPAFHSHAGSAEASGLPSASVDFIVAAQAFHWFDRAKTKEEFIRILRPGGWVALVWNERRIDTSPFLAAYESLLKEHATDYHWVNHVNIGTDVVADFFAPAPLHVATFPNSQFFDLEGLKGRAFSSSYVPNKGQPGHDDVIIGLEAIFQNHAENGLVEFEYLTNIYYAQSAGTSAS